MSVLRNYPELLDGTVTSNRPVNSKVEKEVRRIALHALCALVMSVAIFVGLAGCGDDESGTRCRRAVDHVVWVASDGPGAPGPEEMQIIRTVRAMALATCQREGLSKAQADCILAAKTMDERLLVGRCPAIAERKPSWLQLPPPEAVDELIRRGTMSAPANRDAGSQRAH